MFKKRNWTKYEHVMFVEDFRNWNQSLRAGYLFLSIFDFITL